MSSKQNNADRFSGFVEVYENARPKMPKYPVEIICIEPNDDMRGIAERKADGKTSFIKAFSDNTGLADCCADAVVCSQSFHWMEPTSTLKEVNRILKKGGVFATVDCDWPPAAKWEAEKAYMQLYGRIKELEEQVPEVRDSFTRYPKNKHLENIMKSGYFTYAREILFSNREKCTKERFRNIILSQGSTQTILKKCPELIENELNIFYKAIDSCFDKEPFDIDFCYRMRIGVK